MNPALYNLIVYIMISLQGTPRLDKKQNDIHDKLVLVGFIMLFILGILIGCAMNARSLSLKYQGNRGNLKNFTKR